MTPSPESFPDFELKPKAPSHPNEKPKTIFSKLISFCDKKWGNDSRLSLLLHRLESSFKPDVNLDSLTQLKQKKSNQDQLNLLLSLVLALTLLLVWVKGLPLLDQIDQLKNDLSEQAQVIKMEEQNTAFLEKIQQDRNTLQANLNKVYAALPRSDERAEEIISMLEDMGRKNNILIDSISIRKLPESQLNYDDLWGTVDVYEYTFSVESNLPHILSFIGSLRSSLRIMDIMSLEIEEGKDSYRANFTLNAYHLASEE